MIGGPPENGSDEIIGNYPLTVGNGEDYNVAKLTVPTKPNPCAARYYQMPPEGYEMNGKDLPQSVMECIGFICVDQGSAEGDEVVDKYPVGTCFFVTVYNENKSRCFCYLVTAKHVYLDHLEKSGGYVRVNKRDGSDVVYLPLSGKWWFHHEDAVDLAVLPFNPRGDVGDLNCSFMELPYIRDSLPDGSSTIKKLPTGGEPVFMIAMMYQNIGKKRNLPVVRAGHVALITDELIYGSYGESTYHLVDMQCYEGNSGGPLWAQNGNELNLFGVLSSALPATQESFTRTTNDGRDDAFIYQNNGIVLVTPIVKLLDILESKGLTEMRENNKQKQTKPVPLSVKVPDLAGDLTHKQFEDALKKVSQRLPQPPVPPEASAGSSQPES